MQNEKKQPRAHCEISKHSLDRPPLPAGIAIGTGISEARCRSPIAAYAFIILGATDKLGTVVAGGLVIGLALTLIHLISIPVTNTSVNPARSTGPALVVDGQALTQLWMFWVAPILGAVVDALVYRAVRGDEASD